MKTIFTDHKLDIGGGEHLWLDGNSKVTAGNGTFDAPVANAFSLVSGDDCPYATPVCLKSCYTIGLKAHNPELFEKFRHNSKVIREIVGAEMDCYDPECDCGEDNYDRRHVVAQAVADYATEHCKAGGFRWHVSGDVFSHEYAEWITDVCDYAPEVKFWIYTRSFEYLPELQASNLVVNLSADPDNIEQAREAQRDYGHRICYMATGDGHVPELRDDSVIFPDYALRGRDLTDPTTAPWWNTLTQLERRMVCPPDFFGQSETARCGPCKKCLRGPKS